MKKFTTCANDARCTLSQGLEYQVSLVNEKEYSKKIEDEKLQFLYNNVEIPLSKVLFDMENCGFKVDTDILEV